MSITGLVDHKRAFHRRNDSGELDVFEAARYFSDYSDNYALVGGANLTQKMVVKEGRQGYLREGRVSLDMPSLRQHQLYYHHPITQTQQKQQKQQQQQQQQQIKDKKKYKQPSSPGGKLAQFLNSLFSQTTSKKKKPSKSSSTQSMKDEDESPSCRRKRRSSISHFRSSSSAVDAKSFYSSSSSGFRTPPPYNINTSTTKSHNDFRGFSDYKDVLATLSKYHVHENGNYGNPIKDEKTRASSYNLNRVDEKFKMKNGFIEKSKNLNHGYQEKKREIKKFHGEDQNDGAESDSSSDLFELQIDYEFGFCSSGLPVYETTHMDTIKRSSSTAITNGPIKN